MGIKDLVISKEYGTVWENNGTAYATLTIKESAPVDPAKPTISVTGTYTYTGSEQTATVTGYDSATMNISGNKGTNAGDYNVSVTSKTGKWADGSSTAVTAAWKIEKATPSYTTPSGLAGTKGQALSTVSLPSGWTWKAPATVMNTTGNQTFAAIFTPSDTTNYKTAEENLTVVVSEPAPVNPAKPTISVTGTYTYTGSEQTATVTGYDSATMNITGNKGTNAGDYNVSVTSKTGKWADGSTAAVTAAWKIEKATPSYTTPTSLAGTKGQALSTVSLPSGWAWKAPTTVMNTTGSQTFAAIFTPSDTTNYKTVEVNLTVVVSEPPAVDPEKPTISVTGTYTYTGSEQTATVTGYDPTTMNISGNKGTNAGDYNVSVTSKTGKWADGSSTAVTAAWKIAPKPITAPTADTKTYTYNGKDQTYGVTETVDYTVSNGVQKNADSHTVTVALKDKENTVWADTNDTVDKTFGFEIKQATITITAKNKTAYVGDTAPELGTSDYTISGLAEGESLKTAPTIAYASTPDMTKSGSVVIKASGAEAPEGGNYNVIVYVDGTLTISTKSSGGGGGGVSTYTITVDSAKNGAVTSSHKSAAKGTTVTITVKPDKGFELDTLTVTDGSGKKVSVTEKSGKYTFTMPASKVTVKATFAEIVAEPENPFVDVADDAYYFDAVLWAAEEGITGGTSATTFSPNATCTRAQAVTFLWRAAGSPAPKSSEMPFTDVASDAYYHDAVLWAVENGITKGTSDTTFSPNAKCTRAQIVTFLWRSQKSPASDSVNPFTDVAADAYYNTAVLWAAENGITGGTSATTFSPNNDCTRAQIVTFLYRCLG